MDRIAKKSLIPTLGALAAIFFLLYAGNTVDFLSGVTKPAVIFLLHAVGVPAVDQATKLRAGHLEVPWTGDCAGLNILAILLAVTLWAHRNGPFGPGFWVRLLLAFPIAYLANLARILTLIALRWALYPAVESPQLHYFIGFLWVLPFLFILLRRPPRGQSGFFAVEVLRIAAMLSLIAPFVSAPGGLLVTACTLVLLARHEWNPMRGARMVVLFCGWLAAGAFIATTRMESLWIPWLLVCPAYLEWKLPRMVSLLLLLPGTVPVIAMKPWAPWVFVPLMLWEIYQIFVRREFRDDSSAKAGVASGVLFITAIFHVFPFVAAAAAMFGNEQFPPPPGVMAVKQKGDFYNVRIVRQPPDLKCFWYEPNEGGRHHTLEVCLQYRGVRVQPEKRGRALSDGKSWMTEFFLLPDGTLCDYKQYLSRTFLPFSPNGAHLIYMASKDAMSEEEFLRAAAENAAQIREILGWRW